MVIALPAVRAIHFVRMNLHHIESRVLLIIISGQFDRYELGWSDFIKTKMNNIVHLYFISTCCTIFYLIYTLKNTK